MTTATSCLGYRIIGGRGIFTEPFPLSGYEQLHDHEAFFDEKLTLFDLLIWQSGPY